MTRSAQVARRSRVLLDFPAKFRPAFREFRPVFREFDLDFREFQPCFLTFLSWLFLQKLRISMGCLTAVQKFRGHVKSSVHGARYTTWPRRTRRIAIRTERRALPVPCRSEGLLFVDAATLATHVHVPRQVSALTFHELVKFSEGVQSFVLSLLAVINKSLLL